VEVVRVLEVEVEAACLDGVDGDAPCLLVFHARAETVLLIAPPGTFRLELLDADGFALVIALSARRIWVLVIPHVGGWRALGKEKEVGADAGVGIEDAVGQADNGVEVALTEEGLLNSSLYTLPEESAVRQDEAGAAAGLE